MEWLIILPIALIAGTIGGVIGFGAGVIMVPILVWIFGAKAAVPIMAIAALMANGSRVAIWWREVDWSAAAVYSAAAIPCAILGATTYVQLDNHTVELTLGTFLILVVPFRRWLKHLDIKIKRWHLAIVGAAIGFLTGLVASTGPVNAPFFLMYGLTKGAYIATEALGSVAVNLTKTSVFTLSGITTIENI
ncbi:MAG: sulfite exporter TauE/SafE family protein, partial [Pseudomonadota bacterium]